MPELDSLAGVQSSNPYLLHEALRMGGANDAKKSHTAKSKETARAAKKSFFSLLQPSQIRETQSVVQTDGAGDISDLLDEIHNTGDALAKHPVSAEVRRYKSAVKNFIQYVLRHGFTVQESEGLLNRYKPRYRNMMQNGRKSDELNKRNRYKTVAVIDQKLEGIAAAIMAGQTAQITILARINEIKGLVINLLN